MSQDAKQYVDHQLPNFLRAICHVPDPAAFFCRVELIRSLQEGQITFIPPGQHAVPSHASPLMIRKLHRLGIRVVGDFEPDATNSHSDIKLTLHQKHPVAITHKYVAPWFVNIYSQLPNLNRSVKRNLIALNKICESREQYRIFRGESALYPAVTSTLARHWATDSSQALDLITKGNLSRAKQYISNEDDYSDLEISSLIQHMGGKTNIVDFSSDIWVALFFACLDDRTPPKQTEIGRIYALDPTIKYDDMSIHELRGLKSPVFQNRWDRQSGVAVIPAIGTVPAKYLTEVVRITTDDKSGLNTFLDHIGMSTAHLFNDLEGYMRYEQDYIPVEAACRVIIRLLETEQTIRAFGWADSLTKSESQINREVGLYFRGLSLAIEGKLKESSRDFDEFVRLRKNIPKYVEDNRVLVKGALKRNKNRDYGRKQRTRLLKLRQRMNLSIDKNLWSITLEGITYVEL